MNRVLTTLLLTGGLLLVSAVAFASEGAAGAGGGSNWAYALAAGLGMCIAAFGCGMAQGKLAAAALEGIARNPGAQDKIFTPLLLSLAFPESLVLFTFVICFMIQSNIVKGM